MDFSAIVMDASPSSQSHISAIICAYLVGITTAAVLMLGKSVMDNCANKRVSVAVNVRDESPKAICTPCS